LKLMSATRGIVWIEVEADEDQYSSER